MTALAAPPSASRAADFPAAVPAKPFLVLGIAGLAPFVACAAVFATGTSDFALWALHLFLGYGAVILTFVGALHFGLALVPGGDRSPRDAWVAAGWSVLPALLAWSTLSLPAHAALALLAGGFVAQLAMDRRIARRPDLPGWFLRLRVGLSAVVLACIGTVLVALLARG
jgi:hypothetical protein